MAVKWNNIYRGGVHRTTAETREVNYDGDLTGILPGLAVALSTADGVTPVVGADDFFYLVGEQLYGSVDENQVGNGCSLRLYSPRSGDLYAGRAVAGIALVDDLALTINADGRFAVASAGDPGAEPPVAGDPVHAYVDMPASAHPQTEPLTTVLDQLIPIKIK